MQADLLKAEDVARKLGVSIWTVYRLARTRRLSSVKIGRRTLFTEEDLTSFIGESRAEQPAHDKSQLALFPESEVSAEQINAGDSGGTIGDLGARSRS